MDIEKEIKLLEILESTPMPPDPAPIPGVFDGMVKMPGAILEYFNKINVEVPLDSEGKMKAEDYSKLIEDYSIPTYGMKMVTFVTVNRESLNKNTNNG